MLDYTKTSIVLSYGVGTTGPLDPTLPIFQKPRSQGERERLRKLENF